MSSAQIASQAIFSKLVRLQGRPILQDEHTQVDGASLSIIIRNFARAFSEIGVGHGSIIAVSSWDPVVVLCSALAAGRLGAAWSPATDEILPLLGDRITHRFQTSDREIFNPKESIDLTELLNQDYSQDRRAPKFEDLSPDTPWIISATRGPAPVPRLVSISQGEMFARFERNDMQLLQGEKLRVSGKKRDDLQAVISLLKEADTDMPLQYENFRD